jgi:hypothetical protein
MKLSILFKCDKAAHICDKSQYLESGRLERFFMRLHHKMCKVCRDHSAMNSKLTRSIRQIYPHHLPQDAKKAIKSIIDRELAS